MFVDGEIEKSFMDYGSSVYDIPTAHTFKIKTNGSSSTASIYYDDKEIACFDNKGLYALKDCINSLYIESETDNEN